MRRTLRPGLVVTVSASVVACAGLGGPEPEPPTRNPPPLPRAVEATFPSGPVTQGQMLNPRDADNRVIHRGHGDTCYIELPFATPPTSVVPPPTETVACPEPMLAEAWTGCVGGTLRVATVEPAACVCDFFGNPPPPPQANVCPRELLDRLPQPGAIPKVPTK